MKLHENGLDEQGAQILEDSRLKEWKIKFWNQEWEACTNLVRKTRREETLKAPYQSFDGKNLKSTCMKLGRRKKWTSLSLGWARANREWRVPNWFFKEQEDKVESLMWQAHLTTWMTPWHPWLTCQSMPHKVSVAIEILTKNE